MWVRRAYVTESVGIRSAHGTPFCVRDQRQIDGVPGLRLACEQDDWRLIAVGGVLGFLIGELQVHLFLA
jgi:hypothetical protein